MKQHSVIAQALMEMNHETCRGLEHPVVTHEVAVVRRISKDRGRADTHHSVPVVVRNCVRARQRTRDPRKPFGSRVTM